VNTYDPANGISYRHMPRQSDPYAVPVTPPAAPPGCLRATATAHR
jgi:hypothetical protein